MTFVVSGQRSVVSLCGRMSGLLLTAYCLLACSIPNLEPPECDEARDVVREFYSYHFGNNLAFANEDLEKRKVYLTPRFFESVRNATATFDPFTRAKDPPKAFRAGECRVTSPGSRVEFDVLLFWKTDVRTEQETVSVEAEKTEGKWLVDAVGPKAAD